MQDYTIIRALPLQGKFSLFIFDNKQFLCLVQTLLYFTTPLSKPLAPFSWKADAQGHLAIPCSWQEGDQCILVQANSFPWMRKYFSVVVLLRSGNEEGKLVRLTADSEESQDEGRPESLSKPSLGPVLTFGKYSEKYFGPSSTKTAAWTKRCSYSTASRGSWVRMAKVE